MWTRALLIVCLLGCVNRAKEAIVGAPPEGGGTLSCKEVVEQCDSTCSDPLCLHRCSHQGTTEAAALHDTLLECGERASCTDEACMRSNCPDELTACVGPEEPTPSETPSETPPETPP